MSQEYRKRKIPYLDNDTPENIRKYYDANNKDERDIVEYSNNVLKAYSAFIDSVKRELVI